MAYLGGDQVLLVGGFGGPETWVYDLSANSWTYKAPAATPSARGYLAMANPGGDRALLFGGEDAFGLRNNETWVYDLSANTWTEETPAASPSARIGHAMAYLGGDQVLLFGGRTADAYDNDETWVYDLSANTWTNRMPVAAPSARYLHAMAYLGGDEVLLFGGFDAGGYDDETWVYDLSANIWTNKAPAAAPTKREGAAMAYLGGDQVLLFGGSAGGDETWVYDLGANTWTNQAPAAAPSARRGHAMASLGGDQVVLFGGYDG